MTRVLWNQQQNPSFEFGVDRGMIYPKTSPGVPWVGLVHVEESLVDGVTSQVNLDGITYANLNTINRVSLNVESIHYPEELRPSLGYYNAAPGFILGNQSKQPFGFSYRTHKENNQYKIHLIYNAVIASSNFTTETQKESIDLKSNTWTISTIPVNYPGIKPTSKFIFDTSVIPEEMLQSLEALLYGSNTEDPRLPTLFELFHIFGTWDPVKLYYVADGLFVFNDDYGDLSPTLFEGVFARLPNSRLVESNIQNIFRLEL